LIPQKQHAVVIKKRGGNVTKVTNGKPLFEVGIEEETARIARTKES
jgi:hypothetical protein